MEGITKSPVYNDSGQLLGYYVISSVDVAWEENGVIVDRWCVAEVGMRCGDDDYKDEDPGGYKSASTPKPAISKRKVCII